MKIESSRQTWTDRTDWHCDSLSSCRSQKTLECVPVKMNIANKSTLKSSGAAARPLLIKQLMLLEIYPASPLAFLICNRLMFEPCLGLILSVKTLASHYSSLRNFILCQMAIYIPLVTYISTQKKPSDLTIVCNAALQIVSWHEQTEDNLDSVTNPVKREQGS